MIHSLSVDDKKSDEEIRFFFVSDVDNNDNYEKNDSEEGAIRYLIFSYLTQAQSCYLEWFHPSQRQKHEKLAVRRQKKERQRK